MLRKFKRLFWFFVPTFHDGEEGGGGGAPTPAPPRQQPEVFSKDYVHELREENKAQRLKAQEHEAARQAAEAKAEQHKAEAETKITEANTAAEQRIIRAELKAAALKAGMHDLDGLKLADLSAIKLDEHGEVIGADDLLAKLKESKPYLFVTASSSNPEPKPKPGEVVNKKATEMTAEEANANARSLGIKKFKF